MAYQTVELNGSRFVILPEQEFLDLRRERAGESSWPASQPAGPQFDDVVPLDVGGPPASELLIRDRR